MTKEKISPAITQRLFTAIDEDDVVDEYVDLPAKIHLQYSQKTLQKNYALCLQLWQEGCSRQALLSLVLKQLREGHLSDREKAQYKYMRARYKHLRFAQRLYLRSHYSGFIFNKTTVALGHFQDGFRNNNDKLTLTYGNKLRRFYLSSPVWAFVQYALGHGRLETSDGFAAYCRNQIAKLRAMVEKPLVTGSEFHDIRKIISQQVSFYDTLRSIEPDNLDAYKISRFLAAINGLMGRKHDEMVLANLEKHQPYETPAALDEQIRQRLEIFLARYPS